MAGLRFTDLQSRPTEFLDFTSLTLDEFQQLPAFSANNSPAHDRETGRKSLPGGGLRVDEGERSGR
jgi:hypothetical protein